jgi:predicted permease
MRHTLVVGEVGLAVLLAVSAGLLLRTLERLGEVRLGYQTGGRLVATVHAPAASFEEYVAAARNLAALGEALEALPGVVAAVAAVGLPSGPHRSNGAYAVVGRHRFFEPGQVLPEADFTLAAPGYFRSLGIPILAGREFQAGDLYHAPFVAVVSESLAAESFPGEDPLGQQLQCGLDSETPMTIVGVVGDVRQDSPESRPGPALYMSLAQHPRYANEVQIVVHADGDPAALVPAVRAAIQRQRKDAATSFTTLSHQVAGTIATPKLRGRLAGLFACVALLLAGAGVYGVMAFATSQRRGEMALRLALGARGRDLWLLIAESGLRLVAAGLALGLLATLAAGQLLQSLIFGLEVHDPATWSSVVGVLFSVALVTIAGPAWRAMRSDPARVLRQE